MTARLASRCISTASVLLVLLLLCAPATASDFADGFERSCPYDPNQPFREIILDSSGAIDPAAWRCVAANFNRADILDYRLGPKERHFHAQPQSLGTVWGPSANGLWPFGTQPASNPGEPNKCVVSENLPRSDEEELARGMRGNGWIIGGHYAFLPDAGVAAPFRVGMSNIRTGDGNVFDTGGLCMRQRAFWEPDWWNRNSISVPASPAVAQLAATNPALPLPAVALARAKGNVGQLAFAAFQNGRIIPVRTGNSEFENDFSAGIQLPAGMVPTAMAVSAYSEFLFVTVWDTSTATPSGKLAVITLRPRQMAVGSPRQTPNVRYYWGLPGAWTVTGMKYLGAVDLPFAAPTSLDVMSQALLGNPRGHDDNDPPEVGDLSRQSARDRWFNVPWDTRFGPDYWRQHGQYGYAMVASRSENRVAFLDLRPLFTYYRQKYMTSAAQFAETQAADWPHTFSRNPEQRPQLSTVLEVPQPTAVRTGQITNTIFGITRSDYFVEDGLTTDRYYAARRANVATMAGEVLMFNASTLMSPRTGAPSVPAVPIGRFSVGRNPVAFAETTPLSTAPDDLFVISRGDRSITFAFPNGDIRGVLRDERLVDPVGGSVGVNLAGYGGSGVGRAVFTVLLTVTDFDGKALTNFGVDIQRFAGPNSSLREQYPFISPSGPVLFLYGYKQVTPGRPFAVSTIEII